MTTEKDTAARNEVDDYLAQMDRAGGGIYTTDFRDGFRHALAMLDAANQSAQPGHVRPIVAEAAREALRRRAFDTSSASTADAVSLLERAAGDAATPRPDPDTLGELRTKGAARCDRWHTPGTEPWTGADWSNAMCGEAGEAANIVKKLRRIETGTAPQDDNIRTALIIWLGWELADTIAYADLLAQHYGIDLRAAIAEKFNIVSDREGFPERMTEVTSQ